MLTQKPGKAKVTVTKEWRQAFFNDNALANSTNVTATSEEHCAILTSRTGWAKAMRFSKGICQMAVVPPLATEGSPSPGFSLEGKRLVQGLNCIS